MSAVLLADGLIVAGMLVILAVIGMMLDRPNESAGRMFALAALGLATAVIAAGRWRAASGPADLIAWTLAALALPGLWWPRRRQPGETFAFVSLLLGATTVVLTLMWLAQ